MKLLVAVDGSEQAPEAAWHAQRPCASGLNADFAMSTVQEPTTLYEMVLPPSPAVLERVSGTEGNFAFDCGEALVRTDGLPLDHEIGSGEVAPTLVLITQERGCDGIVLCARGLGAVRGALLGSVSRAILQAATLPVTVVRRIDAKGPI